MTSVGSPELTLGTAMNAKALTGPAALVSMREIAANSGTSAQ